MKKEINKIYSTAVANWLQIILIIIGNLLFIPLILHSWDANLLGIWMILISLTQLVPLITFAHQSYLFNRAFILNIKKKVIINKEIISAIPIAIFFYLIIILFLYFSFKYNFLSNLLNIEKEYSEKFNISILYLSLVYLFTYFYSHFFSGAISVFGYYHIFAWIKALRSFLNLIMPAIAIYFGADFLEAVYILILSEFLSYLPLLLFLLNRLRKLSFKIYKPDFVNGLKSFNSSLIILINYLIDFAKNIGLRLILAVIFSPIYVSYFVALRIISNFVKFSMDSLREPFLPIIMNSFKRKKNNDIICLIELYWLIGLFIICPALILIQFFLPFIFEIWTLNKIQFQPVLFSLLLMSLLFYPLYLPLDIILRGFNENKKILKISVTIIFAFFISFIVLIKFYSFISIGISILVSEICAMILYLNFAKQFLIKKKIKLNLILFNFSNLFIFNTCFVLFLIANTDSDLFVFLYFIFSYIILTLNIKKICSNKSIFFVKNLITNIIK